MRFLHLPLFLLLITTTTFAEDWPQWRGPERNGLAAPGGLPLAAWPQSGPVKVWQADYDYILRGLGSIAIAGGNVFVYGNLRQNEPVESRTLSERALRELGWLPQYPPDALYQSIETARLSPERANLATNAVTLNKWVGDWLTANLKDEETKRKFGNYAADCLRRGAAGFARPILDKLATIKRRYIFFFII